MDRQARAKQWHNEKSGSEKEIKESRRMYGVNVTKVTIGDKIDRYEADGKVYKTQETLWKYLETKGAPKD